MLWYFLRDTVTAYPLRSVVDAEGDPSWWRSGRGVGCDVVHGETRQLTCNFKHVELGAGGDKVQRRWGNGDTEHACSPYSKPTHLVFPPTKALMCRSTGISFGGTMGTRTQPDRFWVLGWTTWLSPSNMPSAKMSTARIIVSREERGEVQGLISIYFMSGTFLKFLAGVLKTLGTIWCWNAELYMSLLGLCGRSHWQRCLELSVGWYDTNPTVCLWHTLKQQYGLCGC